MRRHSSAMLALALTVLLTNCSSGSGGSSGGGGASSAFVPGKWTATLFLSENGMLGPVVEVDMNLAQSGNTISSNSENTVDNETCGGMHVDSTAGTVKGDQFQLVITINSETATLTGTLNADGKSVNTLNTKLASSPGGPCFDGDGGGFSASFIPPLTGTLTGTMQVIGVVGEPGVTATFTEGSGFNVSGSMTVTMDPCFSSLATAPNNPGTSIGSLASFEMTDGTNVVDFMGKILLAPGLSDAYNANFTVTAGCTQESGVVNLNLSTMATADAPAASGAKNAAPTINPVLVERFKALVATRHEH